ncbi:MULTISPECIES: TlpA disulfide reductase family protein [unclassified Rhodococcus (in: high G+C Gram-positive bacteria)]|uniref:TlpA disulfide reductase family protein n=1 Tax=unclassified Rhodococcus (in: high G+C Gram-positive bacteria) TaxID=192944 RepID=UPI0007BB15C0|nr:MULTISPECIES: TlpA disulfide reductase family protein [unclassified Rhodococcus (in: high G+C Gram-positive bacteria)]KZF10067.1 alkyl hydroperoxide reductase [Rhodococcus sp. EPR-147]KZF10851.1 alkyl hydroperoxide reductase [Rhodococcus sp. EPR-279]OZE20656.1 protein disulfide reductase [Rhodococcus sp. 05-2254-6]OZE33081.1 protein disulfide reductase [Rhodococcus sp. 05-2254-4]OZE44023.1 protein disulfide reductase [Rhodococcus sp. 05-2254-3]
MRRFLLGVAAAALVAGCSTGTDAVAQGGTFQFVSPGGQTDIFYEPDERGTIGELSGPDLMTEGKTTSLSDYDGDVVVLNVWGQWCGPCRGEADDLEDVYEATKPLGVEFLGINVRDESQTAAQDFVVSNNVSYASIYDPPMRTLTALGGVPTSVIPTTVVLDRQHRVAAVFLRELLADDLRPVVERVAAEEPVQP